MAVSDRELAEIRELLLRHNDIWPMFNVGRFDEMVSELRTARAALNAANDEVARLRAALAFYGDSFNYAPHRSDQVTSGYRIAPLEPCAIEVDRGAKARRALKGAGYVAQST